MNTYTAKCDICGTENTVASYGDWACRQCGQGYTYDECHQIRLTDSQLALLRNPPRWIPVEERLPESGKRVLVLADVHDVCIAAYYPSRSGRDSLWLGDDEASYSPTHWMPLPSPPEVK